jgi:long-subunit acyl-CoA synthetase (AMP-forming)
MERSVSLAMFYVGAFVAVSSGNVLKLKEDCQTLKVTIFLAVPRIYSRIV